MRPNPLHAVDDPEVVRELVRENPWGIIVSNGGERGPIASHYPIMLDEQAGGLAILTHVGRPDEEIHRLGDSELLCIVQGPHGYVSPGWYEAGAEQAPTWNFTVAHCYGVPELLGEEENLRVLTAMVDLFERELPEPFPLDQEFGARLARGTVGLRIPVARFVCKRKLSQNKEPEVRRRVAAALRRSGPYQHPRLAAEMERELES